MDTGLGSIKFNRTVFLFLVSYYCLSTIMPAVANYISAYLYMGTVVLLFILIIMRNNANFSFYMSFMLPLLLLVLLQVLNAYINKIGSLPIFIYGEVLFLVPIILMYYLFINNNRALIRAVVIVALVAFVITALTTYIGLLKNPDAARILATISDSKDPNAVYWGRLNIGGFETVYSIVLLTPMIFCLFKQKKINLLVFAGIIAVFFLCILQSQYATAFLLFLSSFFLLFMKRNFKVKNVWMLIIVLVCVYFILQPVLAKFIIEFAASLKSRTLSDRFVYLANSMLGIKNDSDVGNRFDLYMKSIDYFLKYPITGTWAVMRYGSGGHSFILDTLAQYGLIGGASLFIFLKQIYVKFYLPFKNTDYYGYMLWNFILFLVLSALNPTGFLIVICLVVPGIAYIIQDKDYKLDERGVPYLESNVGV